MARIALTTRHQIPRFQGQIGQYATPQYPEGRQTMTEAEALEVYSQDPSLLYVDTGTAELKRGRASTLLDEIREMLANGADPQAVEAHLVAHYEIQPLRACTGEAHSNAHIDSCSVCAPRWGWVGPKVVIR